MLGVLIHCWVHLAGVSGGEKAYSGSSIIIIIYPTLSPAIGGQDGMDGIGGHWMTHSNYRTRHQLWLSGRFLAFGGGFGWGKMYLVSITLVITFNWLLRSGMGWMAVGYIG